MLVRSDLAVMACSRLVLSYRRWCVWQTLLRKNEEAKAKEAEEAKQRLDRLAAEQEERRAKYEAEDRQLLQGLELEVQARRRLREENEAQVRTGPGT